QRSVGLIDDASRSSNRAEFVHVLAMESATFAENRQQIKDGINEARDIARKAPGVRRDVDGGITEIENLWERVILQWPQPYPDGTPVDAVDPQQVQAQADGAAVWLRQLIYEAARLTAPEDLRAWLRSKPPFEAVDFHEAFKRDLPDKVDRDNLLNWFASSPGGFPGALFDTDHGKVIPVTAPPLRVLLSYVL